MSPRPTLAAHIEARRHVVSGDPFVILHDPRTGRVAKIGEREWTLICCADGTRDLEGVRAAAAARGRPTQGEHVEAFFAELARAGMLSDGAPPPPERSLGPPPDRPLAVLPGFALRCDGAGTCCRLYPTTAFSSLEVARARVHAPGVLACGLAPEEVFTPEVGSIAPPWRARAVAMVDGQCAFLSPARRCVLHEAGGAAAKPRGCSHYPASFVDDGQAIRVSVAPECACVFRSALANDPGGAPLVPPGAKRACDLHETVYVTPVPQALTLRRGVTLAREVLVRLGDALLRCLGDGSNDCDAARLWWLLAQQLEVERAGLQPSDVDALARRAVAGAAPGAPWPRDDRLRAVVQDCATLLARRIEQDRDWRAESDLARQVPRRMGAVLPVVERRGWQLPARRATEHFYLHAVLHGHLWLTAQDATLSQGLEQQALRLLIARALTEAISPAARAAEPAFDYPLALVVAAFRGLARAPGNDPVPAT